MLGLLEGASAVAGGLGLGGKSGETSSATVSTSTGFTTGQFGSADNTLTLVVFGIVALLIWSTRRKGK